MTGLFTRYQEAVAGAGPVEPLVAADDVAPRAGPNPRALDGATFFLDAPDHVPAVWGEGERVLWPEGEPLLIVGPDGVGKTSLAQQLAFKRHGIGEDVLLGLPIALDPRAVLYVAADRPEQARRSGRRMVSEADRRALEWLRVWRGPLPFDLVTHPERLARFAADHDAGTLVLDSLKDVALDLSQDETGSRVAHAFQHVVAAGVELVALHHPRKEGTDGRKSRSLADVYGSRWIPAACGSVILLWGDAGDPLVELSHAKPPVAEVGPLTLAHDHARGRTVVHDVTDLLELVRAARDGLTAPEAARAVYGAGRPSQAQIEKARRRLDRLSDDAAALVERVPAQPPDPVRYVARGRGSRG